MQRLLYSSEATQEFTEPNLLAMLVAARARNEAGGVTGMLLYAHGSFLQILEGDESVIDVIFDSIAADPRHRDLRVLGRGPSGRRLFSDWAMGFEELDDFTLGETLPGYRPMTHYPLADPALVPDVSTAETLLTLYAQNL